jgi:hypothetical protein
MVATVRPQRSVKNVVRIDRWLTAQDAMATISLKDNLPESFPLHFSSPSSL